MKKIIFIKTIFFFIVSTLVFSGEKIIKLENFYSIPKILVKDDYLYVWSSYLTSIFTIYSIREAKLLRSPLKIGEGPGEIKIPGESIERVLIQKNKLYIYTNKKMMAFSLDGEFLSEKRFPFIIRKAIKCGDRFIGITYVSGENGSLFNSLNVYDLNFKLLKSIYKQRRYNPLRYIEFMRSELYFICFRQYVYVADNNKELSIIEFKLDGCGKRKFRIKYNKYPITKKDKKDLINYYLGEKKLYKPVFHKYFPPFKDIFFFNKKIFILLYKSQKHGKNEFIIFDVKNKKIKRVFLPYCINYTFYSNKYYCVKLNKRDEFFVKWGKIYY